MPLTPQEAFKVGFLSRCAEEGLSADETARCCKVAADLMRKQAIFGTETVGALAGKGLEALGGAAHYGIPAALVAPPLLGGLAGYGLAKATDIDDTDVEDIKNQEVMKELRLQADKLRNQTNVRNYTRQMTRTGRPFM